MLTGKNASHLFRALRLLVEIVIHITVQEDNDDDDLISRLQYHVTSSTTALSLIWISHSGLVLGHKERQSSDSSESWSYMAKY